MITLAIDTSTRAGLTVLHETVTDGPGRTLAELRLDVDVVHGRRILPSIDALLHLTGLSSTDVDACALVQGPGSFTGLRVGLATLQGFALPGALPAVTISSMELLAAGIGAPGYAPERPIIRPVMHARKNHIYTAAFRAETPRPMRLEPDREVTVDGLVDAVREPTILVGNAVPMHGALWSEALGELALHAAPERHTTSGQCLARLAAEMFQADEARPTSEIRVDYLGPCQAEINFMARKHNTA